MSSYGLFSINAVVESKSTEETEETTETTLTTAEYAKLTELLSLLSEEVADAWTGTGNSVDPYVIRDAAGLFKLAVEINGENSSVYEDTYFALENDVDLGSDAWTPIGTSERAFKGTFDGKGYTISGLSVASSANNAGLFGYIDAAEVKNLTVAGNIEGGQNVGGIAGYVRGTATLSGLTNQADVRGSSNNIGGIAGYVSNEAVFTSCTNAGAITSSGTAGGIVGYAAKAEMEECRNEGTVSARNCAGGLAGQLATATISNGANVGAISDTNGYSGGIVGHMSAGRLQDCENEGEISGGRYMGGIVGYMAGGEVDSCDNSGNITVSNNNSPAGGVVGEFGGSSGSITNCTNSGMISAGDQITGGYLGGILGNSSAYSVASAAVTGNTNTGKVGGVLFAGRAGGIMAYGRSSALTVENNCNLGELVYADGQYVGGIAGDLPAVVKDSFSYYTDKDGKATFGITGTKSSGAVENSYYLSNAAVEGLKGQAVGTKAFQYGQVLYYLNGASEHKDVWSQGEYYPVIGTADQPADPVYQVRLTPMITGYTGVNTAFSGEAGERVLEESSTGAKIIYVAKGTEVGFTLSHQTDKISVSITGVTPPPEITPANTINETITVDSDVKITYVLGDAALNGADTSWYSDMEQSFSLKSVNELIGLTYLVNQGNDFGGKTVSLAGDIDLSGLEAWTPIGTETNPFRGTFNGAGKSLNGLKIGSAAAPAEGDYQGLFGYNAGTIHNLTVNGDIHSLGNYAGGIVGYSSGTLDELTFTGKISAKGDYVGGVVGYSSGAISKLVFGDAADLKGEKASNPTSSVTGRDDIGGVVGYAAGAVSQAVNYGAVDGGSRVGGIAGSGKAAIGANNATNINYGPVNATGDYAGGIVGYHSENAAVSYNQNYGDIGADGSYVGGIAGAIRGTTAAANNINHGAITAKGDYVGGVVGSASSADAQSGENGAALTAAVNDGAVIGGDYVGGIAGLSRGTGALHTAENHGAVTGGSYVGGIVGAAYGPLGNHTLATGVKNTAAVAGTGDYIGGLGGYLKSASSTTRTVSYGYNTASVVGSDTSSYVGGIMGWGDGPVQYSYAAGEYSVITVTGGTNVGGLAGCVAESLTLTFSYAYADVNGGNALVGGVEADAEVTYENTYTLAKKDGENAKTEAQFFSGEVAWLLGGGDGERNSAWGQEKGKLPTLLANKPVFKVSLAKEAAPEGAEVTVTDGSFGVPGETDAEGRTWVYVSSGEKFEITTVTLGSTVYGISFLNPLEITEESRQTTDDKTTAVYAVGPITANYSGVYTVALDVLPDYRWYDTNPESSTFAIANEAQMKALAYLVNGLDGREAVSFEGKTLLLACDIAMVGGNWPAIGTAAAPFQGTFEGGGYRISGLTLSSNKADQGLFGYIGGAAAIKNLTVAGTKIVSLGTATGGIVGTAAGNSTLSGLTFGMPEGDESAVSGQSQTGGVVGYIAANTVSIENCASYGAVTGTSNVGGIVGQTAAGTTANPFGIAGGRNAGAVSGESNVGGIAGQMGAFVSLNACENTGDITATGTAAGGIVGLAGAGNASTYNKITACSNTGRVSGTVNVGGIAGSVGNYTDFGSAGDAGDADANVNIGEIAGEFDGTINSARIGIGGIVGAAGTYARFYQNRNQGAVNGSIVNTGYNSIAGVGGLAGRTDQRAEFHTCTNAGVVTGSVSSAGSNSTAGLGGIAGVVSSGNMMTNGAANATIQNCKNTGTVSGNAEGTGSGGSGVGGVAGVTGTGGSFKACANEGTVQGTMKPYIGGVAGILGANSSVECSYHTGVVMVTGKAVASGVGGITGCNGATSSSVKNSYSIGEVKVIGSTFAPSVGGITGDLRDGNSNNYFYKHRVLVGLEEGTLSVPDQTGDELIGGRDIPVEDGACESGELAWRLDGGATGQRLGVWAQDTDENRPTLDTENYKPVYRLLVAEAEHGKVTPSCAYFPKGSQVTLTITPDEGYVLKALGLKDDSGKYFVPDFSADGKTATVTLEETSVTAAPTFMLVSEVGTGPYTITFDLNGGAGIVEQQTVDAGGRAKEPADPTKENFIFAGWYDKKVAGEAGGGFLDSEPFDFSTIVTENIELIACWRPTGDTAAMVLFDMNRDEGATGSAAVPMQIVEFGGKITQPESTPTWEGTKTDKKEKTYTFLGWFTAQTGGTEWNFETELTSENAKDGVFTLYAHWDVKVTIQDGYEVGNADDLRDLGISVENGDSQSGKVITLSQDIVLPMDWVSVGGTDKPFEGEFDGRGFTVTLNPLVTEPLFREVGEDGYVHDVNVEGDLASATRRVFGCIAGMNLGLIDNCTAVLTGAGKTLTQICGGIVGKNGDGTVNIMSYTVQVSREGGTISNCIATMENMESSSNIIGGIAGASFGGKIENCTLTKDSSITVQANYSCVGGIVGAGGGTRINSCMTEEGAVLVGTGGQSLSGGVVGMAHKIMIENTENHMNITGAAYSGGFIGQSNEGCTIKNSRNYGSVTGSVYGFGGFVGRCLDVELTDCVNYGEITGTAASRGGCGGLIGRICNWLNSAGGTASILRCGNEAPISGGGNYGVGGLIGSVTVADSAPIEDSYSIGTITGTPQSEAGLIGGGSTTIENSYGLKSRDAETGYWYDEGGELEEMSLSSFTSGELAYLLDGGAESDRGVWTQRELPVLGTPKVYPLTLQVELDGTAVPAEGYAAIGGRTENIYQGADEAIDLKVTLPSYENEQYGPQYEYQYSVAVIPADGSGETLDLVMLADETEVRVSITLEQVGFIEEPPAPSVKPEEPGKDDDEESDKDPAVTPDDGDGDGAGEGPGDNSGTGPVAGPGENEDGTGSNTGIPDNTGDSEAVAPTTPVQEGPSQAQTQQDPPPAESQAEETKPEEEQPEVTPPPTPTPTEEEPVESDEPEPVEEEPSAPVVEAEPERTGLSTIQKVAVGAAIVVCVIAVIAAVVMAKGKTRDKQEKEKEYK